jgi:hypothetical protein
VPGDSIDPPTNRQTRAASHSPPEATAGSVTSELFMSTVCQGKGKVKLTNRGGGWRWIRLEFGELTENYS